MSTYTQNLRIWDLEATQAQRAAVQHPSTAQEVFQRLPKEATHAQ